jgi:hypothetical protein
MQLPGVDRLFNDAVSIYRAMTLDDRTIDEWWIRKDLKGCGRGLIKVISGHFPGGYEAKKENLSLYSLCPDQY